MIAGTGGAGVVHAGVLVLGGALWPLTLAVPLMPAAEVAVVVAPAACCAVHAVSRASHVESSKISPSLNGPDPR